MSSVRHEHDPSCVRTSCKKKFLRTQERTSSTMEEDPFQDIPLSTKEDSRPLRWRGVDEGTPNLLNPWFVKNFLEKSARKSLQELRAELTPLPPWTTCDMQKIADMIVLYGHDYNVDYILDPGKLNIWKSQSSPFVHMERPRIKLVGVKKLPKNLPGMMTERELIWTNERVAKIRDAIDEFINSMQRITDEYASSSPNTKSKMCTSTSRAVARKSTSRAVARKSTSRAVARKSTSRAVARKSISRAFARKSTSRAVARKSCSFKRIENKVVVQVPKPSKEIDEEESDTFEEVEDVVDPLEDDEEDANYHETDKKDLYCEACGKEFLREKQFIFHHRRHSSTDHYQCPTCLQGFTTLKACYAHEVRQHENKTAAGTKPAAINEESSDEDDESTAGRILPSNSYQLYRGPSVSDLIQCHEVEEKYGLRNRYPRQASN